MLLSRLLTFCFALLFAACGTDSVKLSGEPASVVSQGARDARESNGPGLGLTPNEPLVVCFDGAFVSVLRGDGREDSVGQSYLSSLDQINMEFPQVTSGDAKGLQFYSQVLNLRSESFGSYDLAYTELDFSQHTIQEKTILRYSGPQAISDANTSVLGRSVRGFFVWKDWIILSEGMHASVRRRNALEIEVARWPESSGPYWNLRSLGQDWIAWDRLREGTKDKVTQGLGRLDEHQAFQQQLVMPQPYTQDVQQLGMQRLQSGNFLWLEWRADWSLLAEWDPITNTVSRFAIGKPGDAKVLPTIAVLQRGGKEIIALTNGKEFRFLEKNADRYKIVARFSPKQTRGKNLHLAAGKVFLQGRGDRLYLSGTLVDGKREVFAVTESGLRMISASECRHPDFFYLQREKR